jgi:hypothetical protein
MTDKDQNTSTDDPPGGHDPAALEDAAEKMHAARSSGGEDIDDFDPDGPHDPAALEDAERKMAVKRPDSTEDKAKSQMADNLEEAGYT